MDTNNLLVEQMPVRFIAASFLEGAQADITVPTGAQAGDLLIVVEVEHDNGTTTTPGTTASALPTLNGISLIGIGSDAGGGGAGGGTPGRYDEPNGSDDLSCSFSYKILTSGDVGGTVTNGCNNGDDAYRAAYIFRSPFPITSVTGELELPITAALYENTETAGTGLNTVVTTGRTRPAGISKLNLAFLVEQSTVVLSTDMPRAVALPAGTVSSTGFRATGFYSNTDITSFTNTFTGSGNYVFQVNALLNIS